MFKVFGHTLGYEKSDYSHYRAGRGTTIVAIADRWKQPAKSRRRGTQKRRYR